MHGCGCKKGCATNRCSCRKKSSFCGPGCVCCGCTNLPVSIAQALLSLPEEETNDANYDSGTDDDIIYDSEDEENLETKIITGMDYFIPTSFDHLDI